MADQIFDEEHAVALREFWDVVKDVRVAMLTTVGRDGVPRARPMATQEVAPDDVLWFYAAKDSRKVADLTDNQHVELSYAAADRDLYATASGLAQVVNDPARARELWNPVVAGWFPDGPDDPNLCLLRVDLHEAEYWRDRQPRTMRLTQALTAAVTGRAPASGAEDRKLRM